MLLILSLTLQGCQFELLTEGGAKARVLSAAEVQQCKKEGNTTASTKADILGIPRQQTVISNELTRLARNNAAAMGGDTVVPASKIVHGTQLFNVYKCVPGP
ncbi:MAG TPA: DUF4156 domain-containing protein [Gammaproteobacteria bacterium]|nr:DUF4156 domain-containing protein [Gammaproteobacteria bacterium]